MHGSKELLENIQTLTAENKSLKHQLQMARESIDAIKTGSIDALVISNKKKIKIYTEKKSDKIYKILIEKMQEGAIALHEDGTILYCNSYFAKMVGVPLQKMVGSKFSNFIIESSKKSYRALIKKAWQSYSQGEMLVMSAKGDAIPVLVSANTLSMYNRRILSIILTDITLQRKNRAERNSILIENIVDVITEMNHYSDEMIKVNYSSYISKRLNHNYTYLANIFSAVKGMTIQQFIISNKIEKVKELLLYGQLNLTEISYKLHYSSVAHLSGQFKKNTGLSPSAFIQTNKKTYPGKYAVDTGRKANPAF